MNGVYALLIVGSYCGFYVIMGWLNFRYAQSYADKNYKIGCKIGRNLREEATRYEKWEEKCKKKVKFYWAFSAIYTAFILYGVLINNTYWIYMWGYVCGIVILAFSITIIGWIISDHFIQSYINYYHKNPKMASWQEQIKEHIIQNKHIVIIICSPVMCLFAFFMGAIIISICVPNLNLSNSLIGALLVSNIIAVIPVKVAMKWFVENDFITQMNPFNK